MTSTGNIGIVFWRAPKTMEGKGGPKRARALAPRPARPGGPVASCFGSFRRCPA